MERMNGMAAPVGLDEQSISDLAATAEITVIAAVDISEDDATLAAAKYLRVAGAGNVVLRATGSGADVTIPALEGEYIPVGNGVIVRETGTTATGLIVFG